MRVAITGATGNVGTALLRRLSTEGGHDLRGLARRVPASPEGVGDVHWLQADLTSDGCLPVLQEAFRDADAVVHLAWGFQPTHDPAYLAELGVGGTRRVLRAVEAAGVPHVVHQSSVGVYSRKQDDQPVDEHWPTGGITSSPYSRHKVAAERLLDDFQALHPGVVVTRTRPGLIGQRTAASSLLRYGVPALVPAKVLSLVPVLPLDRSLRVSFVHADDVADAIARILHHRTGGPFNLASRTPLTRDDVATVLGSRAIHLPSQALRAVMTATWHARLQKVDAGWIDLAFGLPLLDSGKAERELGWSATLEPAAVLGEVIDGMLERSHDHTAVLRPRTVAGELAAFVKRGSGALRRRP